MTRNTRSKKKPSRKALVYKDAVKKDDHLYLMVAPYPDQLVMNLGFGKHQLDNTSIKVNKDSISCASKSVFDSYDANPWFIYRSCIEFPRKNKNSVIVFPVASISPHGKAKFYEDRENLKNPTPEEILELGHVALLDKNFKTPNTDTVNNLIDAINLSYELVPDPEAVDNLTS